MVMVRALRKGYAGHEVREVGDVFEWPEGQKLGSWVKPLDKGEEAVDAADDGKPADDSDKKQDGKGKGRGKKAETIAAPTAAPFADAPAPEVVKKGNGVKEELGVAPDWMPPSADDGKPVQADD